LKPWLLIIFKSQMCFYFCKLVEIMISNKH
jgi:hypothetical protein